MDKINQQGIFRFILKKITVWMILLFMSVLLLGCVENAKPADNPYFEDDTNEDFETFLTQFSLFMNDIDEYYNQTYYYDGFISPFDYQTKEGYQSLPQKELYTKEDLSLNDSIIDERYLFRTSGLFYALDNDRFMYLKVLDQLNTCKENTYCEGEEGDFIHYSMNDDQLYFHYRVHFWQDNIFDYMFYFSVNRDKLELTFLYKVYNAYSLDIEYIAYVDYVEGEKEVNLSFDGTIFLSLYDIQTGYVMEKELIEDDRYGIRYYDVAGEVEYWTHMDLTSDYDYSVYAMFYKNHRWAVELSKINDRVDYSKVRLNVFEGWNELHVTWLNTSPYMEFYIANDGQTLAEDLNIRFDQVRGDVFIQEIDFDIASLTSIGITYELDDQEIIQQCDDFKNNIAALEYTYNLYQTNQELLDRFNEKTGTEFTFPLF